MARYAAGGPEDSLYNDPTSYRYKRQRKNNNGWLAILVLVIALAVIYYKEYILPQKMIETATASGPVQSEGITKLEAEILSTNRSEDLQSMYITIKYKNTTIYTFKNIKATASLYLKDNTKLEEKAEIFEGTIKPGEEETYIIGFSGQDYSAVTGVYVNSEYIRQ